MLCFFVENRFFKESSDEEREHAEKFMKYQVGFYNYDRHDTNDLKYGHNWSVGVVFQHDTCRIPDMFSAWSVGVLR